MKIGELQTAVNHCIRNQGLSAHQIIFQRDQYTGTQLHFTDKFLSNQQKQLRLHNHIHISQSKAKGVCVDQNTQVQIGDLV